MATLISGVSLILFSLLDNTYAANNLQDPADTSIDESSLATGAALIATLIPGSSILPGSLPSLLADSRLSLASILPSLTQGNGDSITADSVTNALSSLTNGNASKVVTDSIELPIPAEVVTTIGESLGAASIAAGASTGASLAGPLEGFSCPSAYFYCRNCWRNGIRQYC